jgi:muramoyltetrapeptide carboxypeptidase
LNNLKGLIIGGFTELKDNDISFGQTVEEIILEKVKEFNFPVCFNFPAGHITDNRALIFGRMSRLQVDGHQVHLSYPGNEFQ